MYRVFFIAILMIAFSCCNSSKVIIQENQLSTEEKFWIQKISEKKSPLVDKYEEILKNM